MLFFFLPSSKEKASLAPNIIRNIEHFNAVNKWVMSEIVGQIQLKQRQTALNKFIALARALRDLNNFNGLMEVLSGLRSAVCIHTHAHHARFTQSGANGQLTTTI